ncbi:hypothetical protein [Bradyrhizobium sp. th.b2]|uniref:hypothetical protein n=1 Tax=Bradyrhizobium sp. th-b2 TaxID=172088 RepID=UPI00048C3523|nr:hypothetical protein [Bradyrhizobium sp. th.b2]
MSSSIITQAVERASCVIKATELARPLLPFPELLDRENALRKALAGQVQARTMSLLERNVQIQKLYSQFLEEARSRQSAAPADAGKPCWRSRSGGNRTRRVAGGSEGMPGRVIEGKFEHLRLRRHSQVDND